MKVTFVITLSALLFLQISSYSVLNINPAALVTIGENTYYISPHNVKVSNLEALRFCNDGAMKLVSLETEEKWLEISEFLGNETELMDTEMWTSGRELSNVWQWTGIGQEFQYTAWNVENEEPQSYYIENCVFLNALEGWFDDDCKFVKAFMCEV